jgi:uncharacterized protein
MPAIHLTLLFAGLCALLQCALTILVIVRRVQSGVTLSDGGDSLLLHRIRAHGNFTETAPMALILLGLLELGGQPVHWLWGLGTCLLLGRILHGASLLTDGALWSRLAGMVLTLTVLSVGGLLCIGMFLR